MATIPKIRAGNQFQYVWAIERAGVAVDLTTATDIELSYGVGKLCADYSKIPFTVVDTNKISSSHLYGVTGTYNLKLEFKIDGEQNTIDIDAFRIVPRSDDVSDSTQFAVTSDMAIGFKGDKLTFADLTPSDIAELQQPANDAIASIQAVEVAISDNENNRVDAEHDRNQEEINRQEQEVARQTNTSTAIQNAQTATTNANIATTNANNAATLANTKAGLADTAATNANNVANGYAADLALKELKSNKQNSLATDGTGAKFPTVDAVNAGLNSAVGALLANYTHIGNKEVQPAAIDITTGTFTANSHGFVNGNRISVVIPLTALSQPALYYIPTGLNPDNLYYIVNADANTFKLSATNGGAAITYTDNSNLDITKFYFELPLASNLTISNILPTRNILVRIEGRHHGGYFSPNGFGYSVNIFYQDGLPNPNRYNNISGHKIYGCNDIYISTKYGMYMKEIAFLINSSTSSANVVSKTEKHYYSPSIVPFDITNISIANAYIQNGLNIKIYKA